MKCMITGHRPEKLPQDVSLLKLKLLEELTSLPAGSRVLIGGARGVDTWAARVCELHGIPYDVYVPFKGFDSRWSESDRLKFQRVAFYADSIRVCYDKPSKDAFLGRNRMMAADADCGIAVWDGEFRSGTAAAVRALRKLDKPVEVIPV